MNINKNTIKAILFVSLLGSFTSGAYIVNLIASNVSWFYYLTNNSQENNSGTSISDNGNYFVIGSGNDKLYLFSKNRPKPLWIWRSNSDIYSVDISADSNFILAGDPDITARLFERKSSIPIWNFSSGSSYGRVAISSDGEYSAICSFYKLYLYQRSNSTLVINGANAGSHVENSSQGDIIVSYDFTGGIVYLFNNSSPTPMWQYDIGGIIGDVAITPNGELIAAGGPELYLFNKSSSIPKIIDINGSVRDIDISHDGQYIVVGCGDGIYLFNSSSLIRLWKYPFPEYGEIHTIAISGNGEYIVANLWRDPVDGKISRLLIFNKMSNNPIETLEMENLINQVAISSDGNHISVATEQRAYYINLKNPNIVHFFQIKSVISFISLGSFIGLATFGVLIYVFKIRKK